MADSSDEEHRAPRRAPTSESESDDDILDQPVIGKRITRKPQQFVAGAASGRTVTAKYSPGGTKMTDLTDLKREKQQRERELNKKQRELEAEFGKEEQLTTSDWIAEQRQLVDGWSDEEGSDDELPCAFAHWDGKRTKHRILKKVSVARRPFSHISEAETSSQVACGLSCRHTFRRSIERWRRVMRLHATFGRRTNVAWRRSCG